MDTEVLVVFILVLAIFILVEHTLLGRINKRLDGIEKLFISRTSLEKGKDVQKADGSQTNN